MRFGLLFSALLAGAPSFAVAQRYAGTLAYELTIEAAHPSDAIVTLHIPAAADSITLAMAVHPEYDDRFYRYVRSVEVVRNGRSIPVTRVDSTRWRAIGGSGDAQVHYHVEMPGADPGRGSWRGFLTSHGGLVGGPHNFMYVVGRESSPVKITMHLPHGLDSGVGACIGAGAGVLRARRFRDAGLADTRREARALALQRRERAAHGRALGHDERCARDALRCDDAPAHRGCGARCVRRVPIPSVYLPARRGRTRRRTGAPHIGVARRATRYDLRVAHGLHRGGRPRVLPRVERDGASAERVGRRFVQCGLAEPAHMVDGRSDDVLRAT